MYLIFFSGKGRKVSPYFVPRILCNMAAGHVAIRYGLRGPNHAVSTACSTGSHAIGDAFNFIRNNDAEVMLAGGSDTCINPLSMVGFTRARALSTKFKDCPEKSSRPFDKDRDGFVMGEGACVLVLEELSHALERGAKIYCELVGYGASCDADHITAGLEDGSGAFLALMGALASVPNDQSNLLWLVNAHATSTPRGDAAEMNAIRSCLNSLKEFHEEWSHIKISENGPFVTAHKSNLGHMIGAAGAIETALAALSLKNSNIPGIANLENPEANIGDKVKLLQESFLEPLTNCDDRRLVLKNSFGFGGTNVSLVLAEYKN